MVVNTKQLNVAIKNVNAVQKRTGITNNLTNIIHLKTKDNILTIENTNGFCLHQSKLYVTDSTDFDILLDKINPVTTQENTTEIELVKVDNTKDCIRIDNTLYDVSKQTEYLNTENVYPDKSDYNFVSVNPKFLINALKNAKVMRKLSWQIKNKERGISYEQRRID